MIYITGDTHGEFGRRFNTDVFPEQKEMTKDDYVIICGDQIFAGFLLQCLGGYLSMFLEICILTAASTNAVTESRNTARLKSTFFFFIAHLEI